MEKRGKGIEGSKREHIFLASQKFSIIVKKTKRSLESEEGEGQPGEGRGGSAEEEERRTTLQGKKF